MKPILFNTEMVRAILEGRKTVTRRAVKPQPESRPTPMKKDSCWPGCFAIQGTAKVIRPPYKSGDTLWVRETWCDAPDDDPQYRDFLYLADYDGTPTKWRPSIHMLKEAARLFLQVTDVRVELLQDIDDDGAKAEGVNYQDGKNVGWEEKMRRTAIDRFAEIWDNTIKPADRLRYGWEANPWVWVIEFERISKDEALGGGGDG